nr:MAG TPA: hypothetical protein [Caudoviricetes sp.]
MGHLFYDSRLAQFNNNWRIIMEYPYDYDFDIYDVLDDME